MSKHILCIDDEAEVRDLLAAVLTSKHYRVTVAGTGAEALQVVKTDVPNLIISDLQMEDVDGLELIGEIKQTLPDVPAILLTGVLFDPEVVRDNINKRVSCYIEKTAPLTRILHEVQRLIGPP
jgi:CheY-like chemotaxis protein